MPEIDENEIRVTNSQEKLRLAKEKIQKILDELELEFVADGGGQIILYDAKTGVEDYI